MNMKNPGFTLVELVIAIAVATIVGFAVALFARDILRLNTSAQASMTAMLEGRKILSVMVAEMRSIVPSALGSYPIESAATSSLVFFTDVNADDIADRVRYFIDPATRKVQRGVVLATGEPPAYNLGTETLTTIISDVANATSTPLFEYFDGNYAGTSTPLAIPINLPVVRIVKITIKIERNPNISPELTTLTSQAAFRNLKDNL